MNKSIIFNQPKEGKNELIIAVRLDTIKKFLTSIGLNESNSLSIINESDLVNIKHDWSLLRRGEAEDNYDFKQLISSIVFIKGDRVFVNQRLSNQMESRLHNKFSLTIGGHMNISDEAEDFIGCIFDNAEREVLEEIQFTKGSFTPDKLQLLGVINDDSVDVSKVHFGILFIYRLDIDENIEIKETDKMTGEFMKVSDITEMSDKLENWSKLILKKLEV